MFFVSTMEYSDSVVLGYIFWILSPWPYYCYHYSNCALETDFFGNTGWGKRWGGSSHSHGCGDGVSDGSGGGTGDGWVILEVVLVVVVVVIEWSCHNSGFWNQIILSFNPSSNTIFIILVRIVNCSTSEFSHL